MKIVVLTGSAHKNGTSALLAERFSQGAQEAGHEVFRFDAAFETVHGCLGCGQCQNGAQPCVWQDSMVKLYPQLCAADVVVFSTPVYYHAMTSQLKAVVDRFFGVNNMLCGAKKKSVLLATAGDNEPSVMGGVVATYELNNRYLQWEDVGRVLALNCYSVADMEKTDYPEQAYQIGRSLA